MKNVLYVFSTHWDREWYQTLEEYRIRLVDLMDNVLLQMETGAFTGNFSTDGQTSLLLDYLEMKPEAYQRIQKLATEGRICSGPWYVMPDVFSISGESLVRNLEKGIAYSVALGGKRPVSLFLCDVFGLTGQLPQIAEQSGLKAGFLWRGINRTEHRNLLWRGSDGTVLPSYRFGKNGYWHYAVQVRNGCNKVDPFDKEAFGERLGQFIKNESEATDIDSMLMFDGMDHSDLDLEAFQALKESGRAEFSDLDAFSDRLASQRAAIHGTIEGEQLDPSIYDSEEHSLILGTLSSRTYLKQANRYCEDLLTQIVEPVLALAHRNGHDVTNDALFLQRAWELVLQSHAHDSICGSGIDEIHQDMMHRFRNAQEIGLFLVERNLKKLSTTGQGNRIVEFSFSKRMSPYRSLIVKIKGDEANKDKHQDSQYTFALIDEEGYSIPYQIVSIEKGLHGYETFPIKSPDHFEYDSIQCILPNTLKVHALSCLFVRETSQPCRIECPTDLLCSSSVLENSQIRIAVQSSGRVDLTDKRTGQFYGDLFSLESEEERGNPFHHKTSDSPYIQQDTQSLATCTLVYAGPFEGCLKIEKDFPIISKGNDEKGSIQRVHAEILLRVRSGDPIVYSTLTVVNSCPDHRLQILFPTGAKTEVFVADRPFDVIEKKFGKREEFADAYEQEVETHPQSSFTSVFDGKRGLCIISDGLKEAAVLERPATPIALTLLRSYHKFTFSKRGETDSLMLGAYTYQMEVIPLEKELDRSAILQESQSIVLGSFSVQTNKSFDTPVTNLPYLEGPGVVSSLREIDGFVEMRIWNPEEKAIKTVMHCQDAKSVRMTNFLGDSKEELMVRNNTVSLSLQKKQIMTLRIGG